MRIRTFITGSVLAAVLSASPAFAEDQIVDRTTIHDAIAAAPNVDQANRQVVLKALQQPGVRELAERMGVSLTEAERAVSTMSSAELKELAAPAQNIVDHAGGDRVIVISLTTLLLGIIILLLIAD
jgi:hypothetical protein